MTGPPDAMVSAGETRSKNKNQSHFLFHTITLQKSVSLTLTLTSEKVGESDSALQRQRAD